MSLFDFRCVCIAERQPMTAERLQSLVHRLWRHGLRYSDTPTATPSWEEQLSALGRCYVQDGFQRVPLREACHLVAQAGKGSLTLHERDIAVELQIGRYSSSETTTLNLERYEYLDLRLSHSSKMPSGGDLSAAPSLLDPLQQVASAYAHWCQTLADEAAALVALGYEPDGLDSVGATTSAVFALAANMLELSDWLGWQPPTWMLMWYLGPKLAPAAVPPALLARPGQLVERTPHSGLWGLMEQWEQFRQEARAMVEETQTGMAYETSMMAAQLQGEQDLRDRNFEQAMLHYERAVELARSRGYQVGEQFSSQSVTHLMEMAANLKMTNEFAAKHERLREQYRATLRKYEGRENVIGPDQAESSEESS